MRAVSFFSVFLLCLAASVFAQTPDANGDYFSNEGSVLGKGSAGQSPGSLWRALEKLPCRKTPDEGSAVVRIAAKGAVLEAEVWRGGSDEVLLNPRDKKGKPWMAVRGKTPEDVCYVRAHSRTIQPLQPAQ